VHRVHDDITLGRTLCTRRLGEMTVHKVRYCGGWCVGGHAHARDNLTFMFDGAMLEETSGGQQRVLRACDAVLKPRGTVHSNRCGPDGARTLVIEFADEPALADEREAPVSIAYAVLRAPQTLRAVLRATGLLHAAQRDAVEDLREIVIETLARLPGQRDAATSCNGCRWLARALNLLHAGFATPLRVQDLAREADLHPVYLARAFRQRQGCSITAYRRRLQVADAARRLAGSDEPLASVALRSGFADQSHLCRSFRAAAGVSPGAFRRVVRGN
jgi:AraC family transcriptional regulator